jgi:hypothetical protein
MKGEEEVREDSGMKGKKRRSRGGEGEEKRGRAGDLHGLCQSLMLHLVHCQTSGTYHPSKSHDISSTTAYLGIGI